MSALLELLREVAAAGATITYGELRSRLGISGDLAPLLRAASLADEEAGGGLVSAVVVRDDTGRPGQGWFALAAEQGRDVTDPTAAWEAERRRLATARRPPRSEGR